MDMSIIVVNMLFPLASLMIGDGVIRFVMEDRQHTKFYITEGMIITTLGSVLMFICLPLLDLSFFGGLGQYKLLFFLSYVAAAYPAFFGAVARALDQVKLMSIASISSAVIMGISAYVFIARFHLGLKGYFYSFIIGNVVSLFLYFVGGRQFRFISLRDWIRDRSLRKKMLKYSIPLAPNSLSNTIGITFSRFIITSQLGISFSGLYAAASKIPNLLNILQQIFSQAWQISSFQEFKRSNLKRFYEVIWRGYHALMAVGSSVVIFSSSFLASILMKNEFYAVWPLVSVLVVAFYFGAINNFLGTIYQVYMKTIPLLVAAVLGAVVCVVWTWFFTPKFGINGAAFGVLVGNVVVFLIRVFDSKRLLSFNFGRWSPISSMLILTAQSIATLILGNKVHLFSLACLVLVSVIQITQVSPFIRLILSHLHPQAQKKVEF